jgi:hypothetical protein
MYRRYIIIYIVFQKDFTANLRPQRAAKTEANKTIRLLEGYDDEDAENHVNPEIQEDDVAYIPKVSDTLSDEDNVDYLECSMDMDELVEDAEEWVFQSDHSDDESEEYDAQSEDRLGITQSRDGTEWHTQGEVVGRRALRNIMTERAGFQRGLRPKTRSEAFFVVFDEILDSVVTYTNIAGRRLARSKNFIWKATTRMEIDAFVALHILAGAMKAHHRCLRELYDTRDGVHLFRATMSEKRFEQLKACLRFDDPLRRDPTDRAAPTGLMIERFNERMQQIYTAGENLTIDEMLIEFHGRVSFKQYIPSKPGKFGLKLYWVTEANTAIPLKCILYVGKDTVPEASRQKHGGHVPALVMDLMEPFLDCGRNLTTDNWFTSQKLADLLCLRKTTLIGTLKGNATCLPLAAKSTVGRHRGDSVHYYSGNSTICSYWDKGSKPVNVLSTMHGVLRNLGSEDGKSDIVEYYNATKSGVDILDKLVRIYSSKRKYRRWPCHIFFTLVDCSVYVAYLMQKNVHESQESHYTFKKELAYELAFPLIRCRSKIRSLRSTVKDAMKMIGIQAVLVPEIQPSNHIRRCAFCPRDKDRKSKTSCVSCGKSICAVHQIISCSECTPLTF